MNFYITKVFGFLDKSEKKLFMTIFYIILFDLILILKNKIFFLWIKQFDHDKKYFFMNK